jgi:hypothetical protein
MVSNWNQWPLRKVYCFTVLITQWRSWRNVPWCPISWYRGFILSSVDETGDEQKDKLDISSWWLGNTEDDGAVRLKGWAFSFQLSGGPERNHKVGWTNHKFPLSSSLSYYMAIIWLLQRSDFQYLNRCLLFTEWDIVYIDIAFYGSKQTSQYAVWYDTVIIIVFTWTLLTWFGFVFIANAR